MIRGLALVITRLFDPIFSITIYLTFVLLRSDLTLQQKFLFAPIILLLAIIFPSLYFFVLLREGKISDWDTTERSERFPIFAFIIGCWTVVLFSISAFGTPSFFHSFLTLYILGLFLAGITFFWKISVHAALFTLAIVYLVYTLPPNFWVLTLFVPIVLWTRYYLGKHTLLQLLAGSLLAIVVFFAIISAP